MGAHRAVRKSENLCHFFFCTNKKWLLLLLLFFFFFNSSLFFFVLFFNFTVCCLCSEDAVLFSREERLWVGRDLEMKIQEFELLSVLGSVCVSGDALLCKKGKLFGLEGFRTENQNLRYFRIWVMLCFCGTIESLRDC